MKKGILLLLLLSGLFCEKAQGQQLSNRLSLHLGYTHILENQDSLVFQDGFSTPSLYNNMGNRLAVSFKVTYKVLSFLSLGAGTDISNYRSWTYRDYQHYKGSAISETAIYPVLELHSPQAIRGFFNIVRARLQISPLFGQAEVSLPVSPYFIQPTSSDSPEVPVTIFDNYKGVKASLGLEVIVHRSLGITAAYGMKESWLSSPLLPDTQVEQSFVEAGIFIRFLKNKRFYL